MEREIGRNAIDSLIGTFAVSKAGHDKAELYIIIEETQTHAWLADGRIRTLEKPKKKNKKHIQPIKRGIDQELRRKLRQERENVRDEEIKRAIKLYQAAE